MPMKLFMRKKGRPARYIGESLPEDFEAFEKHKQKITPQPYDFNRIASYLNNHYNLEEKTLSPIEIEIFETNLHRLDYYDKERFSPVFLTVVRNEKSRRLYEGYPKDEIIFIYMEKNSGYIETNSAILHEKLFKIRGVTQEEYHRNSQKLFELIGVMAAQEDSVQ